MATAPFDSRPPTGEFFRRVDALAAGALLSIPYVGPDLAKFFTGVVVPVLGPPRDRFFLGLAQRMRSLEGGFQILLLRLLPLPGAPRAGSRKAGPPPGTPAPPA